MASQKVASYYVALHYLVTAAYLGTPHSSKFARLVSDDFYPEGYKCLASPNFDILRVIKD